MKKSSSNLLALAVAAAVGVPLTGQAQEFFRDYGTSRSSGGIGLVTPSDYSYQDTSPSGLAPLRPGQDLTAVEQAEESDKYNFALGPVRFAIALGFGVEFNDNITLADHGRESDFILRPNLDLSATWRISDLNTLHINIGVGYAKYLKHSEYDTRGLLISPNSDVALTFYTGPVKWTVRDRVSYQEDAYDIPVLSNTAIYRRWENQAGIDADWAINQSVDVTVGYDHYNLWASGDIFDLQDRSIDTIFVKPSVKINPALKVGVNASYSFIQFTSIERANGDGILAGPFVDWQISDVTNMHLEGGYQQLQFNGPSFYDQAEVNQLGLNATEAAAVEGILQDNSNANTYYIKFESDNKPTENFQHRLSFSKTAEIGFESNFYNLYHVEYNADWKCLPHTEIGPSIFYEYYTTSGPVGEDAWRVGAALGIRYHFSNSLTLGLDYRYLNKQSDLADANYYQNLVFLSLYYKF
jgi:opacity protein-like surface antigen